MSAFDEQIGRNVRRLREKLTDSDPEDLALRMRLRGWDWDAGVVHAVEAGTRPLLRGEASDLTSALGFSMQFVTMRTDAESAAEIADHLESRERRSLREAARWWWDVADRYAASGLPLPTSMDAVVAEGKRAASGPDVIVGAPALEDRSMLLSTWEDLPVRPMHPLDQVETGVPWTADQIRMHLENDLREASDGVRYATVRWLRADQERARFWPADSRTSAEQIAAEEHGRRLVEPQS